MIHVTINGTDYEVLNKWEELKLDDLLSATDPRSEIAICIPKLPKEILYRARTSQLMPLYTAISFLNEIELYPMDTTAKEVENESYDNFVEAHLAIQQLTREVKGQIVAINPYQRALRAARIYYPEETRVERLIALGSSIILQIHTFLENYDILQTGSGGETSDWLDKLHTMGAWGTVYGLAGRDLAKMEKIFKMSALQVYTAILYNFMEAEHQKEVLKRRQSSPASHELPKRSQRNQKRRKHS